MLLLWRGGLQVAEECPLETDPVKHIDRLSILQEIAPLARGSVNPHWWGRTASRRLASCTQGPRDGIRACSDQVRHAMVGAERVGGRDREQEAEGLTHVSAQLVYHECAIHPNGENRRQLTPLLQDGVNTSAFPPHPEGRTVFQDRAARDTETR